MIPHANMRYVDQARFPIGKLLLYYIKLDWLAWLFLVVVLGRAYLILRRWASPLLLWDGLAVGGAIYFVAYLLLRLPHAYYLAPVDLIAVLYLGRLAILHWGSMHVCLKAAALVLAFAILLQNMAFSGFRIFERKNIIHAKAQIADVIVARYQSDPRTAPRLFFPFAAVYPVTEFASYLSYRGIPIEGIATESAVPSSVTIASREIVKDGLCVPYRKFVCHPGVSPKPGDLVVELPDDLESRTQIDLYRERGELLLSYEPYPRIPQWLYPYIRHLRVASNWFFPQDELPDRWLAASVTISK